MALKHLILARLMKGPAHGYEMHREPLQPLHPDFGVTEAHIYASLRSLEKDGFVKHRRTRRKPFPERIRYAITPKGKAYLRSWAFTLDRESKAPFARALWEAAATRLFVMSALRKTLPGGDRRAWISATEERLASYERLLRSDLPTRAPLRTLLRFGAAFERAIQTTIRRPIGGRGKGGTVQGRGARRQTGKKHD